MRGPLSVQVLGAGDAAWTGGLRHNLLFHWIENTPMGEAGGIQCPGVEAEGSLPPPHDKQPDSVEGIQPTSSGDAQNKLEVKLEPAL